MELVSAFLYYIDRTAQSFFFFFFWPDLKYTTDWNEQLLSSDVYLELLPYSMQASLLGK